MNENDNVVSLPTRLERAAKNIKKLLDQRQSNREEWIEQSIELAVEVAEARQEFQTDKPFGQWWDESNFGLNKDIRAALVKMGSDPIRLRTILQTTVRNSYELIYRYEWKVRSAPKPRKIRDRLLQNISKTESLPEVNLTKTQEHKIETIVRVEFQRLQKQYNEMVRDLNAKFEERVEARLNELKVKVFPRLQVALKEADERMEMYNKLINDYKAPLTVEEYRAIVTVIHPDNSASEETRARALQAITDKRLQLTGKS